MINATILTSLSVILFGCASTPKQEIASGGSEKNLSFPKLNEKTYVIGGGLVHLKTAYKSGYRFKVKNNFTKSVQLGFAVISIGVDQDLQPSTLDGEEYHCATEKSYREVGGATGRNVCFLEKDGKFIALQYAPRMFWIKNDLVPPVDVVRTEVVTEFLGAYAKKELIYNGSKNDTLMFIEKDYGSDLQKPLRVRPVNVNIRRNSEIIEISGAKIRVFEYNSSSMTFAVEKVFD